VDDLLKNNIGLQVLTDSGWSNFAGLLRRGNKQTVVLQTQTKNIICTLDHKFFSPNFEIIAAGSLKPRNKICVSDGIETIVSIAIAAVEPVYDLLEVEKNHRFYANGILIKNCEFLIYDETLINSSTLIEMAGIEPLEKQGQVRWYKKPDAHSTYVVSLDPSLGTGGDPAAIQVIELPSLKQVGEWNHNKTPIQRQVQIMNDICAYLHEVTGTENSIYYSVENNTLGEAALMAIAQIGEENFRGIFLTEPSRPGQKRARKGFNTTAKSKLAGCAKMKSLIEQKKLHIASKLLVSELKTFVALGNSYEAKEGETDDLVMSLLLAIRMIQALQNFDADLDEKMNDASDYIDPMPFIMTTGY
jgi:Terminase RNaseH-like domain